MVVIERDAQQAGTIRGPHGIHARARPARLCTLCALSPTGIACMSRHDVYRDFLGVKWSQVQILSARQEK